MDSSIDAALAAARRKLPGAEARMLLRHALGRDAAWLAAHGDATLAGTVVADFTQLVARRADGEPIAYLIGEREFFGRSFRVTPDVLIPRPETELLVELSLAKLASNPCARLLELGTGSGCLAVTLACEAPRSRVVAVDTSTRALAVAEENAQRHGAAVEFIESDWLSRVDGQFDFIVANPPYIAAADAHLGQGDLRFEPQAALVSGSDGLDAIRAIVAATPRFLFPAGWLLLEHGYGQAAIVADLLRAVGMEAVETHRDLAGLDRVTAARFRT